MQFDPRAIALGLGLAQADRSDHLVLAYTLDLKSVAEAAVIGALGALSLWNFRPWRLADNHARDFFGAGGFSLVRREANEQLGGFHAPGMEVLEDLRLALKIKRAGYRQRFVLGPGLASIRWIEGAFGLVAVLEKNGFAGLLYRTGLALLRFFGLAVQIALRLAAMALGGWPRVAGLMVHATIARAYRANRPISQASPWLAVFFAPATAILLFALIRSMALALTRGAVARNTLSSQRTEPERRAQLALRQIHPSVSLAVSSCSARLLESTGSSKTFFQDAFKNSRFKLTHCPKVG